MKLHELYEENNLIGKSVDDQLIYKDLKDTDWYGDFNYFSKSLDSLVGSPKRVTGDFNVYDSELKTLKGCPITIGKDFNCSNNKLKSLEHAPEFVGGDFICSGNNLTNFKDIHETVKQINGIFWCYAVSADRAIKSHVLGLLKIKNLKEIIIDFDNLQVQQIINKYLKEPYGNKRVIDCQSELLDAELDEYAQL